MVISNFSIQINKDSVFHMIDCYNDSPIFDEVTKEYNQLLTKAYQCIHPRALLHFGEITKEIASKEYPEKTKVIYALTTIGSELSELSTSFFQTGNYLAGLLANAMADDYLFQMDDYVSKMAATLCKQKEIGIVKRLEAPHDIPLEAQKVAFEQSNANELLGIKIKESYMYDPVKTSCQIYVLTEDSNQCHTEHDCRNCGNIHCKLRHVLPVTIKVMQDQSTYEIQCRDNQSLLSALIEQNIYLPALCNGHGTCGKCKIRVTEGTLPQTSEDKQFFTDHELKAGYRLACRAYPKKACTILLPKSEEENPYIVTASNQEEETSEITAVTDGSYAIAIDIGTTTIAIQLIEEKSNHLCNTYTVMNHQRAYGADVISRIQASNVGKRTELQSIIKKDLLDGILKLTGKNTALIDKIVISGNTTMIHLLMGYSCETIGVYPFHPVNIKTIHMSCRDLFKDTACDGMVTILPGISTFVGGDIVSGLYSLNFDKNEEICLLIDLGTNGEMAIGNKDRIMVCSTAAGPAFEGGNISCGVASVEGAISSVEINDGQLSYHTIGDKAPIGLCGTGVLECVYELLTQGLIDETGLLEEEYFDTGYPLAENCNGSVIQLTQKDIREIQLAKAAVRAGVETLMLRYGVTADDIAQIYIAGGFGYRMNLNKAIGIGLFPEEFMSKLQSVGNTSLKGSRLCACDSDAADRIQCILDHSEEISLSMDQEFMNLYTEHMMF